MARILLFCFLLFSSFKLSAQSYEFNAIMGTPVSGLKGKMNATAWGLDAAVLMPFSQEYTKIQFGANLSYLSYGINRQDLDFGLNIIEDDEIVDRLRIPLNIRNYHSIFGSHALLHFETYQKNIAPYVRAYIGARRISTRSNVSNDTDDFVFDFYEDEEDDLLFSLNVLRNYLFSYGAGAGIQIFLNPERDFLLNIGFTYLTSNKVAFFDRKDTKFWNDIPGESEVYAYDLLPEDLVLDRPLKRTRLSMVLFRVGIQIPFSELAPIDAMDTVNLLLQF